MKLYSVVFLGALLLPALGQAEEATQELVGGAAREYLEQHGEIVNSWQVNENLVAIVLETAPGEGMTLFSDASGEYLLSGAMVELESGKNIAEVETARHFPGPTPEQAYEEARSVNWLSTGREGDQEPIYAIVDMQCSYCHKLAKAIAKHGVTREIRWVIVGYLGPKSRRLGAALLEMEHEPAARAMMALLTGAASGDPGTASPAGVEALEINERWAENWGIQGTPYLLIPHEGEIQEVVGLPQESLWEIIH